MLTEKLVRCPSCEAVWNSTDLEKSCGNCFACTGCEMWICASCGYQIVIRAPGEKEV